MLLLREWTSLVTLDCDPEYNVENFDEKGNWRTDVKVKPHLVTLYCLVRDPKQKFVLSQMIHYIRTADKCLLGNNTVRRNIGEPLSHYDLNTKNPCLE